MQSDKLYFFRQTGILSQQQIGVVLCFWSRSIVLWCRFIVIVILELFSILQLILSANYFSVFFFLIIIMQLIFTTIIFLDNRTSPSKQKNSEVISVIKNTPKEQQNGFKIIKAFRNIDPLFYLLNTIPSYFTVRLKGLKLGFNGGLAWFRLHARVQYGLEG